MKFVFPIIAVLVLVGPVLGQDKLPEKAVKEIKAYKKEIASLNEAYEKIVVELRLGLDEKLTAMSKDFVLNDKLPLALLVEQAKKDANPPTSVANRLGLQRELSGKKYRWKGKGGDTWKFESDSTILSLSSGVVMPWVALTHNEILLLQRNGTLRVLRFNEKLTGWTPYFLPAPKIAGKHGGAVLID